jgi:hypothetical protein
MPQPHALSPAAAFLSPSISIFPICSIAFMARLRTALVMRPPIIVDETGALMIFDSPREAERYLEWVDVEDGRFRAWDREGRPLVLSVVETPKKGLFRTRMVKDVVLEQESDVPTHAEMLRGVLVDALRRAGKEPASSEMSLPELIEKARRWFHVS